MKILILSSVYPQPDDDKNDGITSVVHYFAKEWVASGHEVHVIHNANKFILPLYILPLSLKKKINSFLGMAIPKLSQRRELSRISDGVKINRLPILKVIPRRDFFQFQIAKQFIKIKQQLTTADFIPEIIVGHWEAPQLQLVSMLKDYYGCKSALIFHGLSYINKKKYRLKNIQYLKNIDVLGGRSKEITKQLKRTLQLSYEPFVCYSGIPDAYVEGNINNDINKSFKDESLIEFLYVGRLIKRKNVDSIIKALKIAYENKEINLNIIGVGECENDLKSLTNDLSIDKKVHFNGLISRENVLGFMRKAQCFTMISKDEVYGLVYLEAMSQGCIVIASRGEGFDGIIIDGKNGFLCEAGNEKMLAEIYTKINLLSREEKEMISQNAKETSINFKDSDVAKRYLKNIY